MVIVRRASRLQDNIQRQLVEHFVAGTPARMAAELAGVSRHTATLYYHKIREVIAARLSDEVPFAVGAIEVDESYFGGHRKGKRGRGAGGKVPVFGLLKRADRVHAVMIPNCKSPTLVGIIRERVQPDSIVYSDSYSAYDVLDVSEFHHKRVNHREEFVAPENNHINGIENFWSQAKRWLRSYNGIPRAHFHLYLKECEWRFNYRPASRQLLMLYEWLNL